MIKNELFEIDKSNFKHTLNSSNVSLTSQLEWWKSIMQKYAYDSEAVKECNDEIFKITRRLAENINSLSEIYVEERAHLNDFEKYGDTAIDAFDRVKTRNYADMQSGLITWEEYTAALSDIGALMYQTRLEQSEKWLKNESKYNNLSLEDYIAGLERMKAYTEEYYQHGIISYRDYCDNIEALSNAVLDKEREIEEREAQRHKEVYQGWISDAENWKKLRDTYGDWEAYDDSPVKFYERCIERIKELYNEGHIGWQEYMNRTMDYSLDLYNAKISEIDKLLETQSEYIQKLKTEASDSETSLKDLWETEDRRAEIADIKRQMRIYKNSVTERGMSKYADLSDELKSLEREEKLYKLQQDNNAVITALEEEYGVLESDKKLLLASIESTGIDIERLIDGINSGMSGIESVMAGIASQIIKAINSKNTYSDNRSFNISAADSSTLKQFTKNVEETIARGRYY